MQEKKALINDSGQRSGKCNAVVDEARRCVTSPGIGTDAQATTITTTATVATTILAIIAANIEEINSTGQIKRIALLDVRGRR